MIVFTSKWTHLDVSCDEFCDVACDSTLSPDFVYQDGEVKLRIESSKFLCNKELEVLPDENCIPYCLHIRGVQSINVSFDGPPDIYVTKFKFAEGKFQIGGSNGQMVFSGHEVTVAILRDDLSHAAMEAVQIERERVGPRK